MPIQTEALAFHLSVCGNYRITDRAVHLWPETWFCSAICSGESGALRRTLTKDALWGVESLAYSTTTQAERLLTAEGLLIHCCGVTCRQEKVQEIENRVGGESSYSFLYSRTSVNIF